MNINCMPKGVNVTFGVSEVKFLRCVVSQDGIFVDLAKVETVISWVLPKNVFENS